MRPYCNLISIRGKLCPPQKYSLPPPGFLDLPLALALPHSGVFCFGFFCVCELNFLRPPPPKHDTLRLFIGFVILHTICSVPLYSFVTFRVVCHWVALPWRRRFSLRATHILRQHIFRLFFSDPTTHFVTINTVLNIRNSNLFLIPLNPFDDVVRIGEIIH